MVPQEWFLGRNGSENHFSSQEPFLLGFITLQLRAVAHDHWPGNEKRLPPSLREIAPTCRGSSQ
jgi:hypothetical protein